MFLLRFILANISNGMLLTRIILHANASLERRP